MDPCFSKASGNVLTCGWSYGPLLNDGTRCCCFSNFCLQTALTGQGATKLWNKSVQMVPFPPGQVGSMLCIPLWCKQLQQLVYLYLDAILLLVGGLEPGFADRVEYCGNGRCYKQHISRHAGSL
ncbi:unnamed protein product [Ostreobium quekettii]|uniref:Uncharacterized protein n=1 Tax=Ostreobium quekettii TaxID=121088 RepID=A0A8S1JEF1_9CHLO|nr:unnamed protein product [Ostreobium quekettii]